MEVCVVVLGVMASFRLVSLPAEKAGQRPTKRRTQVVEGKQRQQKKKIETFFRSLRTIRLLLLLMVWQPGAKIPRQRLLALQWNTSQSGAGGDAAYE